jgi:phosphohistidine swiveling domain-containing protein
MDVTWEPPGPGTWERDRSHFAPTVSRLMIEMMEDAAPRGIREGFDLVGAPLDTMDVKFVNGQFYRRLVPIIGGAATPRRSPPSAVVRVVFAVHPRLRRRARTAAAAMENGSWNAEADRWDRTWKPELVATNRRFAAVDVASLDGVALADHLEACITHCRQAAVLHFRLHVSDLGPIGRLIDTTGEWGIDPVTVMATLAGASPSTSAPKDALRPIARLLSDRGVSPSSLDEVRAAGTDVAELLDAYLLEFGSRLTTGYDLTDRTLVEIPELTLAALTDPELLVEGSCADRATRRGDEALDVVREQVPPTEHARFDELIADARRLYGLRDENGPLTVEWPAGVLRYAVLEAGRRLAERGRLLDAAHVVNLSGVELVTSLRGEVGPKAEAIATRDEIRRRRAEQTSPRFLGPEPVEPDLDALPEAMRKMMRISVSVVALLEASEPDEASAAHPLTGTGVGERSYVGTARVVTDAEDAFDRVEPGDVIIAPFTVPTFNSVLALAGAVVTEQGGLLCHTAVIARELGIPGIVGVAGAHGIPDGSKVEVNPVAGTVTIK